MKIKVYFGFKELNMLSLEELIENVKKLKELKLLLKCLVYVGDL